MEGNVRRFPQRGPSPGKSQPQPAKRLRWLLVLVALIVVAANLVTWWVDLLWFEELGQKQVLLTRITWSFVMGVVFGLLAFGLVLLNLVIAQRVARHDMYIPFLAEPATTDAPEQVTIPPIVMRPISVGIALVIGLFTGIAMSGRWETVLRWTGRTDFGIDDPRFNHDVSFYIFTIPLFELVIGVLQALIIITALVVAAAYVAMGVIRYTPILRIATPAITHLGLLAAAFFVVQAVNFRIAIWNLVLSERSLPQAGDAITGAGYTDLHARLPGLWVLVIASIVLAGVLVYSAIGRHRRVPLYAGGAWVVLFILGTALIPGIVQKVLVEPNELVREEPVLENNIRLTREAYGLHEVKSREFASDPELTAEDIRKNRATIDNVRLWNPEILRSALAQTQELRKYYTFNNVDVDRYTLNDEYRQTMISAREIRPGDVASGRTWVNQRLQYTHGYGVAGAWVNRVTGEGLPELFIKDIPPEHLTDVKVEQPAVYYGEEPDHYVIVNTKQEEFDYPEGDKNKNVRYAGDGGIRISNFARKLALSFRFADARLMLTQAVTDKSRFMFRRNIEERVHELAPFLDFDTDPYITIIDGKLLWVIDAYTTSDRFPYSEYNEPPLSGDRINYVRNSVKATVDAYSGEVRMYIVDERDPMIEAWKKIFPSLFEERKDMPKQLEAHLRYPEDLFRLQSRMWAAYHMGEPRVFYNKEDLWEVPSIKGSELEPFYVLVKLPGEAKEEMVLIRPMTPTKKQNMVGWIGARMDPGHYGELITYELAKGGLTYGPAQIAARINQDGKISQQINLWTGAEGDVQKGDLLVVPIEDSLLYIQPVYLISKDTQLPELRRVIVAFDKDVRWGESLPEALGELFGSKAEVGEAGSSASGGEDGDTVGDAGGDEGPAAGSDDTTDDGIDGDGGDSEAGGEPGGGTDAEVLEQVSEHYNRALECQRAGDWECYGRETEAIGQLLETQGRSR